MKYKILLAIDWIVVFLILRTFTYINYPSTAHFVNLPITYKSKKSIFKSSKNDWNKKDAPEYV